MAAAVATLMEASLREAEDLLVTTPRALEQLKMDRADGVAHLVARRGKDGLSLRGRPERARFQFHVPSATL